MYSLLLRKRNSAALCVIVSYLAVVGFDVMAQDGSLLDFDGISLGGLLEVEASVGKEDGEEFSDIVLATFELGVDADITDWLSASAVLLWEEDDTESVTIDEGIISISNVKDIPLSIDLGKMYIPFGTFNSFFITDPLTLELGETRESAAVLGYSTDLFEIKGGVFNGDINEDNEDHVSEFVFSITVTLCDYLELGAYWVSDVGESDGLEEGLIEAVEGSEEAEGIPYDDVSAVGGYVHVESGAITVEAEYIAALDSFNERVLGEGELEPKAWNIECAFTVTDKLELAAKYEGTDDYPGMPETQLGVAGSYALADNISLALEYLHGAFDGDANDRDIAVAQLGVEF
jgi:hypothetical protein